MCSNNMSALRRRVEAVAELSREAKYLIKHPAELAKEADGIASRKHPKALANAMNDVVAIVFADVHVEAIAALARARAGAHGAKDDVRQLLHLERRLVECMFEIR